MLFSPYNTKYYFAKPVFYILYKKLKLLSLDVNKTTRQKSFLILQQAALFICAQFQV
jgi:hypothetical protein